MKDIILPKINCEKVADEIGDFIVDQVVSIGYTGCVVGLSGGVDSTVAAGLAKRAFDKYNVAHGEKLRLNGYILPSKVNSSDDARDGIFVAGKLGIPYEVLEIEPLVEVFRKTNPECFDKSYDLGNLYSEVRALVLHRKAGSNKKLVLGTGNRGEDFGIGYYTLFGDGAVHLSPIAGLSKRLVREMSVYLGFVDIANRIPTAGLENGQTDFGDLGYSYDFVELIDEGKRQGFGLRDLIGCGKIVEMFEKDKREYAGLFGEVKFEDVDAAILDVARREKIAKVKAEIISPPVAKVNLDYK